MKDYYSAGHLLIIYGAIVIGIIFIGAGVEMYLNDNNTVKTIDIPIEQID